MSTKTVREFKDWIYSKIIVLILWSFENLKRRGKVSYKLDLPSTSKAHHVFHVSHLRKHLYNEDNVADEGILVEFTKPPSQPHEPKRILDCHELRTCHHV